MLLAVSTIASLSAPLVLAGGPPPLANIGYLGQGYNIFYGNPRATGAGVDPGFHKYAGLPVYTQKYTGKTTGDQRYSLPDGFHAIRDNGCSLEFSAVSTYTFSNLTTTLHVDVSVSVSAFIGPAFSASTDYKEFHQRVAHSNQRSVSSTAECVVYDATMNAYAKPALTDDFAAAVAQLPDDYQDSAFFDVIDHFGTHTIESAKMGSRFGFSSYFSEQAWTNVERTAVDVKTAASYEGLFVSGSVKTETQKTKSAQEAFDQNMTGFKLISLGSKPVPGGDVEKWAAQVVEEPMPISYHLRSICEAMGAKRQNCEKALTAPEYCTKRLLKERGDVVSCQNLNDMQCIWDGDCRAGYSCVNSRCHKGALAVAWRPNPHLCLEVSGNRLRVNNCNGSPEQQWIFNSGEYQNYMQIQWAHDTSKCVDGGNMSPGAALVLNGCSGAKSQTWARDVSLGAIYLPNGPGGNTCMDAGSGIKAGKEMIVWGCNVLTQQQFDVVGPSVEETEMPMVV